MTEEPTTKNEIRFQEWEDQCVDKVDILLDPKTEEFSGFDVRGVIQEAFEAIEEHCPQWQPQEDLRVVVLNTRAKQGSYIGRWSGKHYLLLTCSGEKELQDPYGRTSFRLRIAHELFHQRVAETLGVDDLNGLGIEEKLEKKIIQQMTDFQKAEFMACTRANASFLQKIINEGCVVNMELKFLKALLTGNNLTEEEREAIMELKSWRGDSLQQNRKKSTYSAGFNLISKLLDIYQISLIEILEAVDWEKCEKIKSDSQLYRQIMENPRLIPGMELLSQDDYD
ncbi:hypothetical protein KJ953_02245 [Patescibacteria group bacterium]|nr:hypothetical protein [Patescibacteria group bacterium]